MNKSLTGHILIENIRDDFNILEQFLMIVFGFPPFSYAQYNQL